MHNSSKHVHYIFDSEEGDTTYTGISVDEYHSLTRSQQVTQYSEVEYPNHRSVYNTGDTFTQN